MVQSSQRQHSLWNKLTQRLRDPGIRRFIKFSIVGGSGVVVNMGLLSLGMFLNRRYFHLPLTQAVAWAGFFAIAVSIITNFFLNDIWTWGDREKLGFRHFLSRFCKYVMVASAAGLVQWLVLQALVYLGLHYLFANLVGIGVGIVINYCANNWWTFRAGNPKDTQASAPLAASKKLPASRT